MMSETALDDALFDVWHESTVRVRYAETDRMGVVYHANYLIWFEIGRTEFCRARGFAYREMEENSDASSSSPKAIVVTRLPPSTTTN
jgi:hypothetical protein